MFVYILLVLFLVFNLLLRHQRNPVIVLCMIISGFFISTITISLKS